MFRTHLRRLLVISSTALHLLIPKASVAAEAPLTRARIAELVRAAPAARAAASEAAVAGAAVTAAGVISLENPVLSGMGGIRFNPDGGRPAAAVASLSWPVELGGRRGTRVEAAKAEQRAALATAGETQRRLLLAALLQHALVLRDEAQVALAAERRALAQRLVAASEKRNKAGEVPQVDVALARLQEGRDAAAEATALGTREADLLGLRSMLGQASKDGAVTGALVPQETPPPLATLLREADQRADVRAAMATVEAARARSGRERAGRWPTLSVLAQYERDDQANIGMIGLALPVPILNANRAGVATAEAEVDAATARLAASRASAAGEIQGLYARYEATRNALAHLAPTAGLSTQAVALSTRGYELGENDLASVLLARREALDAQAALLDAEHAHANATIELLVAAGRFPR
ncbi:TolC family protein [Sorangium sp. So ce1000]|uniref:TolC family protein n=1 Tax=Sorangium sp. So ce1000 TaxID=3133325 RepID=UPI003F61A3EE